MKTIALVTYKKQSKLQEGDKLLIKPFEKHGVTAEAIPWDDENVNWQKYDLVILRSPWNYHLKPQEFVDWINKLERLQVKLWDPPNIVKWNMNKKYLFDLEKRGIPIIPTILLTQESIKNIINTINSRQWEEIIIKPTIGASSYQVHKLNPRDFEQIIPRLERMLPKSELLIQPFMREIQFAGEISFIFINKQFSHAVLKKPKGGAELAIKPDRQLIIQAQKTLDKIESPLLYARIDGLNINGQLQLMELELVEPYLFFEKNIESAEKFVEAAITLYSN